MPGTQDVLNKQSLNRSTKKRISLKKMIPETKEDRVFKREYSKEVEKDTDSRVSDSKQPLLCMDQLRREIKLQTHF